MHCILFPVILLLTTIFAVPLTEDVNAKKCGYESCHKTKPGFINVHIVPHTHDDVGWLKTVDQYYYGSNTDIQKAGVQYILDSVIEALKKDTNRRFIYVETSFFWKWWMKQHDFVKHHVKKFINNGQLEFIGGGWSMNDEATTHYQSIIDQFSWGLRKLNDSFGECGRPKIGWQIDPFGHSREMASIFAQLGFDGLLLGRIDYQDKKFRFATQSPEMIWQGSDSLGNKSQLFTSVMYNNYAPPPGFCFDVLCDDEPIIDDKRSPDYNVDQRIKEFLEYAKNVSDVYQTNNVIITMGEDFNYQDANMWFKNLDKLISYANLQQQNGSKYHLLYSTPSCYLKAVNEDGIKKKINWKVKTDDFFPYASDPDAYWTGYFTSKPNMKRYERMGNNFLQVCKQLYALTDLGPEDWVDLNVLREAMGVMQHHDAITGTEKEHVAHDYARMLSKGFDECAFVTATALSKLAMTKVETVLKADPVPAIPFETCHLANISQCAFTETSEKFIVTVYNPLSRPVTKYVRLPVTGTAYTVTDPKGTKVEVQLIPIHDSILKIPGRFSQATIELVFGAEDIPALGFKSYYVEKTAGNIVSIPQDYNILQNENISIKIDDSTGLLYELTVNGKDIPMTQEFLYYRGTVGSNLGFKNRSSGAYIFRPNGTEAYNISTKATFKLYKGPHVTELHQTFNNWTSQIIKIYNKEDKFVEFDWLVGPIPVDDVNGKEIILRYKTKLNTESTFYTDSNGREMLKRVRNFRPTWKLDVSEPVAGNYYPVTSKILMRDPIQDIEVAILTDRAQGGSSMKDGELELMIHRNCLHDDAFGVDEPLNQSAFGKGLVVRGTHYLLAGPYINNQDINANEHDIAQQKLLDAWTFVSPSMNLSFQDYKKQFKMQYSGLSNSLPNNVQILTLEPWKGMGFLLRLEHVFGKNENAAMAQAVKVDLKNLFATFDIIWFRETTLGANQWLNQNDRLQFKAGDKLESVVDATDSYFPGSEKTEYNWIFGKKKWEINQFESNDVFTKYTASKAAPILHDDNFEVVLNPMQIRTFLIEIKKK